MKNRIVKLMEAKNVTATKFAEMINANPSAISHILNGRNKPSYDMIMSIAQAFPDINLEWLMRGNGEMLKKMEVTTNNPQMSLFEQSQTKPLLSKSVPEIEKEQSKNSTVESRQVNIPIDLSIQKSVKKIMLFYSDGTFEEFTHV